MKRSAPVWLPEALSLRAQGWSYSQIGSSLGVSKHTIGYQLGVKRRSCVECGEEFEGTARRTACSPACASQAQRRAVAKTNARPKTYVYTGKTIACAICAREFYLPPAQSIGRKCCSVACAAEYKRRRGGAHRKGTANPNYKNGGRSGVRDREGERRWYAGADGRCSRCGATRDLCLHHVCYRQHVVREGGDPFDPANSMTLCRSCHAMHHHRRWLIPLGMVPEAAVNFAVELLGSGRAEAYFERRYDCSPRRLEPSPCPVNSSP